MTNSSYRRGGIRKGDCFVVRAVEGKEREATQSPEKMLFFPPR